MRIKTVFLLALGVANSSFAGQPLWAFSPTTATSIAFPANLTSSIMYTVYNQSAQAHTLVIKPLQGISQVGSCILAPQGQAGDSCTLNLLVTGSELPESGISGGPILCQSNSDGTANSNQCYQPSLDHVLNITVTDALPESVTWLTHGVVTPVKNQGLCNSSYAFSTTGALEGFYAIQNSELKSFSEQQVVSCSANSLCDGGTVQTALDYILNQGGIALESAYPYTALAGVCNTNVSNVDLSLAHIIQVPAGNEIALAQQVVIQPVAASIRVGDWFQSYSSEDGVITPDCNSDTDYQSVLVVGYTPTYWIIKNSYGASWGHSGYLYLTRGINACGIADQAFSPS